MGRYSQSLIISICLVGLFALGATQLSHWQTTQKPIQPHKVSVKLSMFQINAPVPATPTKPTTKKLPPKKIHPKKIHPAKLKPKTKPRPKKPKPKIKPKKKLIPTPKQTPTSTPKLKPRLKPNPIQPKPMPIQASKTVAHPPAQKQKRPPALENKPQSIQHTQASKQAENAYLNALTKALASYAKDTYPRRAKRHHWEGKVTIAFTLLPNGEIIHLHLIKPSDWKILDNAALDIIREEMQNHFQPFPSDLHKKSWTLNVPIQYHLR